MDSSELAKSLSSKDILVSPDALELLSKYENALEIVDMIAKNESAIVITKEHVEKYAKREEKIPSFVEVVRSSDFKPIAREYEPEIRILDTTGNGNGGCKGSVEDFVSYFRDRYRKMASLLRTRPTSDGISPLSSLQDYIKGRKVRIIGIVSSKETTKNGHIKIDLEDEDATVPVIFMKNSPCFEEGRNILLDEVVAIDGEIFSPPAVIAKRVVWPDLPIRDQPKRTEKDIAIAFLSDIHIGSKHFLARNFANMISWLNGAWGDKKDRELAGKVKYLLIAGDISDGVGIYPKQEKELVIKDIYEQYKMFCDLMKGIPDYVEVIVAPGNHDAVRRAEPQPRLPKELVDEACIRSVDNPCRMEIEGLKTLMYHGTSLDSIIAALPNMSYETPEKAMIELLKRRHLSPIYGENPIVPENRDRMIIAEEPDIVHMGHIHKNGYETYRGAVVINSGTWQDRTDFQIKQGHMPTPCLLPVYEAKYGKINVIDFTSA
ncbi:MAG: DNA-directed DNA polymerase II small subunit [Candidatus Micrarchaeia archaeon]